MRIANLSYTVRQTSNLPPYTGPLTFALKSNVNTTEPKNYLHPKSTDTEPISFTSDNPAVAAVKLISGYWKIDYVGAGVANILATQNGQTLSKAVSVAAPITSGRTITAPVDTDYHSVTISKTALGLLPGDTVVIPAGQYNNVNVNDIIVPDGQAPIIITCTGLVEVVGDMASWGFKNLRNVIIDGSRVPGVKHGFVVRDNIYVGVYVEGNMDNVTMYNFACKNIYNSCWNWGSRQTLYDGTAASYSKGCKFINFLMDNAGSFDIDGNIDMTNSTQIRGLCVDFQFIGWEIINSDPGTCIRVSVGQDIIFKDISLDMINPLNCNHNGIFFVQGTADVINCSARNHEGNLLRLWFFTIIDGHINGRTTPKTVKWYGNALFVSRKYSAFEYQGFDRFYKAGVTDVINLDIFHNTIGNLNQNIPSVFSGTLVDNYGLRGGTVRIFNNMAINPVNPGHDNIFNTYGFVVPTTGEIRTGDQQQWNNRSYDSYTAAKVNPATLAPQVGCTAIGAADVTTESLMTVDMYGNLRTDYRNIGAIQGLDFATPASLPAPTVPDTSQTFELSKSLDRTNANMFAITTKQSYSPVGVKNYDVDVNGNVFTTKGGYGRTGRQDPEQLNPDWVPVKGQTYKFRFRARDWRDQLSGWTNYMTFRMIDEAVETGFTALVLTKTSGGTLTKTGTSYKATVSDVYVSTGISVNPGDAARILIDKPATGGLGVIGFAASGTITALNQIQAGLANTQDYGNLDLNRITTIASGTLKNFGRDFTTDIMMALYLDYDGRIWQEVSYDSGKTWERTSTSRYEYFAITTPSGVKNIVAMIGVGNSISNPRYKIYPAV